MSDNNIMDYYKNIDKEIDNVMNDLLLKGTEESIENLILKYNVDVNYDDGLT